MIAFFMIFPALFMTHEMEELIFMPGFVTKLPASKATKKVQAYYSPLVFNLTVLEQLLLLLLILGISYYSKHFGFYVTVIIAYIYHIVGHLVQSFVLRKYVPGLIGGIITAVISLAFLFSFGLVDYRYYLYALVTLLIIFGNILLSFKMLNQLPLAVIH